MQLLDSSTEIAPLVRQLQGEGATVVVVPGAPGKGGTMASFAQILGFPEYFAGNLDSFEECLGDWAMAHTGSTQLIWDGAAALRIDDIKTYTGFIDILTDLEHNAPAVKVTVIER